MQLTGIRTGVSVLVMLIGSGVASADDDARGGAQASGESASQTAPVRASPDVYHFQPESKTTEATSKSLLVEEREDGSIEIRLAESATDGTLASIMSASGTDVTYLPDALGSRDIRVTVNKNVGHTTLAGLKFESDCVVNIWKDGSVEVDREGVAATGDRGAHYVSRSVLLDGRASLVMVREVSAQVACEPIVFEGIETESGSSRFDGDLSIQEETEDGKTFFRVKPLCGRSLPTILRDGGYATVSLFRVGGNHVLIGKLEHSGYVFESDADEPLVLKLTEGGRYVHLCGRGQVRKASGEPTRVGYDIDSEQWLARLKSKDIACRSGAAWSFAWSKDKRGVPGLVEALRDPEAEVRRHTAASLGAIGDKRAIAPLVDALADMDSNVRFSATDALVQFGWVALKPLVSALGHNDADVRRNVAEALGELGDDRAIDPLIAVLEDSEKDVRDAAAQALHGITAQQLGTVPEEWREWRKRQLQTSQEEDGGNRPGAGHTTNQSAPEVVRDLFPVVVKGKWGYIDSMGRTVIEPQFNWVSAFSAGPARSRFDGTLTILNGFPVEDLDSMGSAREALALVISEGSFKYIDKEGRTQITLESKEVSPFSEGLAPVKIDGRWGYIDETGGMVVPAQFEDASYFVEGLAPVTVGGRRGYIDKTGRIVIEPRFLRGHCFSEGVAAVKLNDIWGFIDRSGRMLTKSPLQSIRRFSEGLGPVQIDSKWGYVDKDGKLVIQPQFDHARSFAEGLAAVKLNGLWGFIDKAGNIAIKAECKQAGSFSEGLAPVAIDEEFGYVDKEGALVIPAQFLAAYGFVDGLARVSIGSALLSEDVRAWGYIDRRGNWVWKNAQ